MSMNMTAIMQALEMMWKGMVGIFVALVVIMIFVWIMAKIGSGQKKQKDAESTEKTA